MKAQHFRTEEDTNEIYIIETVAIVATNNSNITKIITVPVFAVVQLPSPPSA